MHVVAAPDKFKGTASAAAVAAAVAEAATAAGGTCDPAPMADGGEGTLEALGGPNRSSTVTGPLGHPVTAAWRLRGDVAVIEAAQASGLVLAGGPEANDPVAATTAGVGELIAAAVSAGARRVLVGVGGSATTDGGLGALKAMPSAARLRGVRIEVACDVATGFTAAAAVFAPQKGASAAQVELLTRRLERLAQMYADERGVDVAELPGAGAAGGLAGGLAAAGAELVSGFDLVAEETDLYGRIDGADLVVTGEGCLDDTSFEGKVVGGVARLARAAGVPVWAVVGADATGGAGAEDEEGLDLEILDLSARFGPERAMAEPGRCVYEAVLERLGDW